MVTFFAIAAAVGQLHLIAEALEQGPGPCTEAGGVP